MHVDQMANNGQWSGAHIFLCLKTKFYLCAMNLTSVKIDLSKWCSLVEVTMTEKNKEKWNRCIHARWFLRVIIGFYIIWIEVCSSDASAYSIKFLLKIEYYSVEIGQPVKRIKCDFQQFPTDISINVIKFYVDSRKLNGHSEYFIKNGMESD